MKVGTGEISGPCRLAAETGGQRQPRRDRSSLAARINRRHLLTMCANLASSGARAVDPRQGLSIELPFSASMALEEAPQVKGMSTPTIEREWSRTKAWLNLVMHARGANDAG